MLELFCGSSKVSRRFANAGYITTTVDVRKRKGICEPDIRKDVMKITPKDLPFSYYDVVWVGLPCDVWSYAAGGFHWHGTLPKTEKCLAHILLLQHVLHLIDMLSPAFFFIENPRGRLRNFPLFIDWLNKSSALSYVVTLSSYGFPSTKPTNIFSNFTLWRPKVLAPFGRGAKCTPAFDKLTKNQRQSTPTALITEIIEHMQNVAGPFSIDKHRHTFV